MTLVRSLRSYLAVLLLLLAGPVLFAAAGHPRSDFYGNGTSDLLWRNGTSGQVYMMPMSGGVVQPGTTFWTEPDPAWQIVGTGDFDGDGKADILWWNSSTGQVFLMLMNGSTVKSSGLIYTEPNTNWQIVGVADFTGDGKADILWRNVSTGQVYLMPMNGLVPQTGAVIWTEPDTNWKIVATDRFMGTATADILWWNSSTGQLFLMQPNGINQASGSIIYQEPNTNWQIVGSGDFNGDGTADVLWRNISTGQVYEMPMSGGVPQTGGVIWTEANLAWQILAIGDFDGSGKDDIVWRNSSTGQIFQMLMNGLTVQSFGIIYTEPNTAWNLQGGGAVVLATTYKPVITAQPQATVIVNQGSPFTLSATAVGNPSSLTYQWYKNGSLVSTQVWPSGTPSTNTIFSATSFDAGTWYVLVSNSIGGTQSINVNVTVVPTHAVSGRIYLANGGTGVPGVEAILSTTATPPVIVQRPTTDSNGNFQLLNIPDGAYTLTPSLSGPSALFFPATLPVTVAGADVTNLQIQAAIGYTVSGTVSYAGTKTGPIYLRLDGNNGGSAPGVSISAKGTYSIRGVAPGTYTLNAWMDNIGQGNLNASNPTGSLGNVVVGFGNASGANVTLADPGGVTVAGLSPGFDGVSPMDSGAFIQWRSIKNAQGVELADSYLIQWSTSSSFTPVAGSVTVPAKGKNNPMYFAGGLTNGTPYYFCIYGMAGATTSNAATFGPVTPNPGAGFNTVSGTVTFTGKANGPLYVGLYDQNAGVPYVVRIASPVSPQSFSVLGVPNGTNYFLFGIIDQNNNGYVDSGDINNVSGNGNNQALSVTGNLSGQALTLPSTGATASGAAHARPKAGSMPIMGLPLRGGGRQRGSMADR